MGPDSTEITRLLKAWSGGDQEALEQLTPKVYTELRRMAGQHMRNEHPGSTLQATALVNELYLKLVNAGNVNWQDRAHFFAVSAMMMRRILVGRARKRNSEKRGGSVPRVNLDDIAEVAPGNKEREIVAIDEALQELARMDARKAKVVELRFFGGLSVEETAEVLKISGQSVMRDWKLAKAWLMREMKKE
jgi:RNA polymerase sigma-70 factor (ECF subfamily)